MNPGALAACARMLAGSPAFRAKRDIAAVAAAIDSAPVAASGERIWLGDDTAAIPDRGEYLLLAAEGILPDFLERDPWFAGWSAVMVNVNDVAAMGGRALAVVDVLFAAPDSPAELVLAGMAAACAAYGVPLVGGHTTRAARGPHALAVAILGRAAHLMTSFGARPGDDLLLVVDVRGRYREPFPFFDAATGRAAESLRGDLALLEALAASGAVHGCKDVSNAGVAGTVLMLLEASGAGGVVDLDALPVPAGATLERWLQSFPSFGFVLAVAPGRAADVAATAAERGLTCARIGAVDGTRAVRLASAGREALLWDLATCGFTGFGGPR